ncbi:MAG: Citrate synthase 2, partial [Planctomycetota bacterium]
MNTAPAQTEFAKGLAGVTAGRTAICSLEGGLRYRGYDIEPLARAGDIEEVAYLLLHGELPTPAERAAFGERITAAATTVDPAALDALATLARTSP